MCVCVRERERETDRQTDRQTDRHRERDRDRDRDRQTDRQIETERDTQRDRGQRDRVIIKIACTTKNSCDPSMLHCMYPQCFH